MVNAFAEMQPADGKGPTSVMRAPGITSFAAPTIGAGRGCFAWNNVLYCVVDTILYQVSSAGVCTALGTVSGSGIVTWGINTNQLVICTNPDAYVWDGTTLAKITDSDYTVRGGGMVGSLDSYVLFNEPNSGRFFCSDLDDATSYDPLYFATAEGFPDNLVGLIVDHRQVFLAGLQSIELWYDAGGSGFPFQRDTNGLMELGCAAGQSLCKVDNSVFWLASDLTVRRLNGLTPTRVSQHGVEQAIASYTVSDAYAFTYTQDGHINYVLTFPTDNHTWIYDVTTGEWHERESFGMGRWRACSAAYCYGRNIVMDYSTGALGVLDSFAYTEFGDPLRAEWTFGSVSYAGGNRTFHAGLECIAETGVGVTTGQGSVPEIMLDISNDGGRTWRAFSTRKMGATGEYHQRIRWQKLGSSRDRIYRMAVSDPVKVTVSDAQLELV